MILLAPSLRKETRSQFSQDSACQRRVSRLARQRGAECAKGEYSRLARDCEQVKRFALLRGLRGTGLFQTLSRGRWNQTTERRKRCPRAGCHKNGLSGDFQGRFHEIEGPLPQKGFVGGFYPKVRRRSGFPFVSELRLCERGQSSPLEKEPENPPTTLLFGTRDFFS